MKNLSKVLLLNAVSSGLTGLFLVADASFIAGIFETKVIYPFISVGIFLVFFSVIVFLVSRTVYPEKYTGYIITADVLWVLVSLAILLLQILRISATGYFLITAVALWVAAMAFFQYSSWKKILYLKDQL